MWLLSLRDLQWRRRRFLIAIVATSLIFALTLLVTGTSKGIDNEVGRIVSSFDADRWVVDEGATGPFTSKRPLDEDVGGQVADSPGVEEAAGVILFRGTLGGASPVDVNLIGYEPGALGSPAIEEGREAIDSGEVVVDVALGIDPGETIDLIGEEREVVGTASGVTFFYGVPTVFAPLADLQEMAFGGLPLVTSVITRGESPSLPDGVVALTNTQVEEDLRRPTQNGSSTIDYIRILLWLTAAGIIASIVYLTSLERLRDVAVLKATGAPNRVLVGSLVAQAMVLSLASALLAIPMALLMKPGMSFDVVLTGRDYLTLALAGVVIGGLASLAGLRRALAVDPALAFGS